MVSTNYFVKMPLIFVLVKIAFNLYFIDIKMVRSRVCAWSNMEWEANCGHGHVTNKLMMLHAWIIVMNL